MTYTVIVTDLPRDIDVALFESAFRRIHDRRHNPGDRHGLDVYPRGFYSVAVIYCHWDFNHLRQTSNDVRMALEELGVKGYKIEESW